MGREGVSGWVRIVWYLKFEGIFKMNPVDVLGRAKEQPGGGCWLGWRWGSCRTLRRLCWGAAMPIRETDSR